MRNLKASFHNAFLSLKRRMRLVGWRQDAESSQPKADKNYYESSPDSRLSMGPQTEPQVSEAISHSVTICGDIASDDLSGNLLSRTAPESLDEAVAEWKAKGIIEQIESPQFPTIDQLEQAFAIARIARVPLLPRLAEARARQSSR